MNLLRRVGLVTVAAYDRVADRLLKAESRLAKADAELEQLRAAARAWKAKAEDAHARLKAAAEEAANKAAEFKHAISQLQRHVDLQDDTMRKDADRYARRISGVEVLQVRLNVAERELVTARDQLMTVDTKLDILEAAANVLDLRTRAALTPSDSTTSSRTSP